MQSTALPIIVRMCQMLELQPGLRVLEIDTGSGYTSALLSRIAGDQGSVISLDVDPSPVKRTRTKHAQSGVSNTTVHCYDGYLGWPAGATYDRVIGWTTPHLLPRAWVEQAADRAVIVAPVTVAPIAQAHLLYALTSSMASQSPAMSRLVGSSRCAPR
jgi:protein-L-isoaspartate(D-aspartate) O-methyltransferase